MRATWLLTLAVLGCARAPVSRTEWYRQPRSAEATCSWKQATRWHDTGVLLAPGTGLPLARWVAGTNDKRWDGATVTGAVKRVGPHYVFEGTWRGDGLILDADVAASEEPMFFTTATLSLGRAAVLPRGASLRIVDETEHQVLVEPDTDALTEFTPVEKPRALMACEAVSLYPQGAEALKWAGFDPDSPGALLDVTAPVPVFDAPGGERVGTFNADPAPRFVRRLEARDGWTHVALEHASGMVWHGWVSAALKTPEGESNIFGRLMGGGLGLAERVEWKACAVEQRLYARVGGRPQWVGRMLPATPFRLGAAVDGLAPVTFHDSQLFPEEGVEFLLSAQAAQCGPWIPPEPKKTPEPKKPPAPVPGAA